MNVFYMDEDPQQAATKLCKVHVRKMIVESAQLLCTAHHEFGTATPKMYKPTHKNHPSAIWVREGVENYNWLYSHYKALCELFKLGGGKVHLTDEKLTSELTEPPRGMSAGGTSPPLCMPEEYKQSSVTKSYQDYVASKYQEWQQRDKPIKVEFYT